MKNININSIRLDGGTQSRAEIHADTVAEYADALADGTEFPPIVVFYDGVDYWLGDGFHRVHAFRRAGRASISADVRVGTQSDAQLFSYGVNAGHGLRRSNADKRKAVEGALKHAISGEWSDNQIAKHCGVSHPFVGSVRSSLETVSSESSSERTYTTKHGTQATMKTGSIGGKKVDGGLNTGTRSQLTGKSSDGLAVVSNDRQKTAPKLADAGISKDLSSRAQKLAAVPEAEFEAEVGEWRDRVSAEGARVTTRLEKAGERELRKTPKAAPEAPPAPENHELEEAVSTINELAAENDQLRDRVAVAAMSGTDEERAMAAETIAALREQIKTLEAELDAVRTSRDSFQRQNAELMKQVRLQQKQIKKLGG